MVKLTLQELQHLEKLANVNISADQEGPFLEKLDSVVNKLDDLDKVDVSDISDNDIVQNPLRVISWVKDFSNKKWIIDNAKHEVINNSIVIKSALSE